MNIQKIESASSAGGFDPARSQTELISAVAHEASGVVSRALDLQGATDLVVALASSAEAFFGTQVSIDGGTWIGCDGGQVPAGESEVRRYTFDPETRFARFSLVPVRGRSVVSVLAQTQTHPAGA